MTDINTVEKFAKLENEKAALEDSLAAVKAKLDELRPGVLAYFESHSIDKITSAGRTLYLREELWPGRAEGKSPQDLVDALDAAGLSEFADRAPRMQSLAGYVRELARNGEDLPEALRGVLVVNTVHKIGSRRS